ncbi:EAL domain-containing protein [Thalassotalea fusca]
MKSKTFKSFNFLKHCFFTITLLVVLVLLVNINSVIQSVSTLYDNNSPVFIDTKFSYLKDTSGTININDIFEVADNFTSVIPTQIPFSLENHTYWIKVQIQNLSSTRENLVLFADNNFLADFDVYLIDSSKQKVQQLLPKPNTTLFNIFPHHTFSISSNTTQEILIKITSEGPPSIPLKLITPEAFETVTSFNKLIYGIFIGGVLVIALYYLVLFITIKDIVYLIYVGYLFCALLIMSAITGFSHLMLTPELQPALQNSMMLLHFLLVIFLLLFTIVFLRFDPKKSLIFRTTIAYCIFLVGVYLFTLPMSHQIQANWFFGLQPVTYLLGITAVFVQFRSKIVWAKYYALSWLPLLIGSAIQPLVLLNIIESSYVTRNAFLFAVFVEIILMSFALAERVRRLEFERFNEVTFHLATGIPRKTVLENKLRHFIDKKQQNFSVIVIAPKHLDLLDYYLDETAQFQFLRKCENKLNSLFRLNNAVVPLIKDKQKVCIINNNKLAVIVDNSQADQPLETLCKSIQFVVSESAQFTNSALPISCNLGIASYPVHAISAQSLINKAIIAAEDAQLNVAHWQFYQGNNPQELDSILKLAVELRAAIASNELALYHQPQVDLKTRQVCSSECLLRWFHPEKGEIAPDVFIPIAEKFGLINEVTLWVINRALQQQRMIIEQQATQQMLSINISIHDILHEQFLLNVVELVDASEIPADKIIFELTDVISSSQLEKASYNISQLQELGITVSTNSFESKFTDLANTQNAPFQEVKITRQITNEIVNCPQKQSVAHALFTLAKGLNMEVVAEGITTEQEERFLRDLGCDIGQGFFYARPMSIDDYLFWLSQLSNGRASFTVEGELVN